MIAPIVDTEWLAAHDGEIVLADVRWYLDGSSGRAAYEAGHIPGAVFVDLETALAQPASSELGRHPLPDPDAFAAAMGSVGIGERDTVIAYDDAGGVIAARLVWMLRVLEHPAALLDGGLQAWPGPLERETRARAPARFAPRAWPDRSIVSTEAVAEPPAGVVVIDARTAERYRGEGPDPVDPRPGHIPGARSVPCRENLDHAGRLLPVEQLRRRFAAAGVAEGSEVISYCGSGVTACHNLLALEHAGLGRGRLYPGSWSQWSRDPDRPAAVGAEPSAEPGGGSA